jgi:hypothetical protein
MIILITLIASNKSFCFPLEMGGGLPSAEDAGQKLIPSCENLATAGEALMLMTSKEANVNKKIVSSLKINNFNTMDKGGKQFIPEFFGSTPVNRKYYEDFIDLYIKESDSTEVNLIINQFKDYLLDVQKYKKIYQSFFPSFLQESIWITLLTLNHYQIAAYYFASKAQAIDLYIADDSFINEARDFLTNQNINFEFARIPLLEKVVNNIAHKTFISWLSRSDSNPFANFEIASKMYEVFGIKNIKNANNTIMYFDIYHEFFSNPKFQKMVFKLSNIIDQKIIPIPDHERAHALMGNLWDDTKQAALEAGLEGSEIEDYAWKFLALYSTGGANTPRRLLDFILIILKSNAKPDGSNQEKYFSSLLSKFSSLSIGIAYLDARAAQFPESYNSQYSMPPTVLGITEYRRPYHFYMAGQMTRYAIKELGATPEVAAKITFSFQLAYLIFSTSSGRTPGIEFGQDASFHYNIRQALALTYGLAGIQFAINPEKITNVSTSTADELANLKILERPNPPIKNPFSIFYNWIKMFDPWKHFDNMVENFD